MLGLEKGSQHRKLFNQQRTCSRITYRASQVGRSFQEGCETPKMKVNTTNKMKRKRNTRIKDGNNTSNKDPGSFIYKERFTIH